MDKSKTPLTDRILSQIAKRLAWRGARSAAARYSGISRQNLGKLFREKGVPRDSEVILKLIEFSKLSEPDQRKRGGSKPATLEKPGILETTAEEPVSKSPDEELPHWML